MSIHNYWPFPPRAVQTAVAEKVEKIICESDGVPTCVVVNMPTGAGKSPLAVAIARWAECFGKVATIIPPNGELQRQYQSDYRDLTSLWGESTYHCSTYRRRCDVTRRDKGGNCTGCPHSYAVAAAAAGMSLMNPYTFLAYRKKKAIPTPDLMIIDEAHTLVDFQLAQTGQARLWRHLHDYPDMSTTEDLIKWLDMKLRSGGAPIHRKAKQTLLLANQHVHIETGVAPYRGKDREYLEIRPLTARFGKPVLWNNRKTKHLILLSATITPKTVHEVGLDRFFDVKHVDCDSPIPHAARPVYYRPLADMSMPHRMEGLQRVAEAIAELLDFHEAKGFIHATYEEALMLQRLLTSKRLMWHDHSNKANTIQEFYDSGRGNVLIGSGMREGIDLKGSRAHWQVITKIPFPNLGDSWVRAKAESDPEWYDAQAVQELLQSVGRVCRGPDDFGSTYIFDSRFDRLYTEREYLFPSWFKNALRWST